MSVSDHGIHPDVTAGQSSSSNALAEQADTRPLNATPAIQERRLQRVLDLIEQRPSRSVRDLAREVCLSPARLQRLFKHVTGVDVSMALAERRLQQAAHLLSASDMQIKEIAYLVGYEHHSSFVRAFQRRFALTPRLYRQQASVEAK
jgi:transcriptional regulator GlxA family with amidase domain